MRRISYGINSYRKTVSITVDYAKFYIFILHDASDFICGYLVPSLPLPNFKITRDGEKTTVKEYYGDLQSLFHIFVHLPIFNYCWSKTDSKGIEVDYDKAREMFYNHDKKFWDKEESFAKEMKEEDKNKDDNQNTERTD